MYLAIDVGGTYTKYGKMSKEGEILEKGKLPTICDDKEAFLQELAGIYKRYEDVEGIAVSCPGRVDTKTGIIYGGGSARCLDNVCLPEELSGLCGGVPVSVENDGKCAGLAEVWLGAAKDVDNCCVMAFGTGVAGAVIRNRKVIHGNHLIAGEFSFLLHPVSREGLKTEYFGKDYSAVGIVKQAEKRLGLEQGSLTGEKLFQMAKEQVKETQEVLENFYFRVAVQCYNLQYMFDPDIICIGGGISEQPAVTEGIRRYVEQICEKNARITTQFAVPQIRTCMFRNDSNLIGALYHYLDGGAIKG